MLSSAALIVVGALARIGMAVLAAVGMAILQGPLPWALVYALCITLLMSSGAAGVRNGAVVAAAVTLWGALAIDASATAAETVGLIVIALAAESVVLLHSSATLATAPVF